MTIHLKSPVKQVGEVHSPIEVEELRELIVHMHVHAAYRKNGYEQMTTKQKAIYDEIWAASVAKEDAATTTEPAYNDPLLSKEEADLVVGAIPLEVLPVPTDTESDEKELQRLRRELQLSALGDRPAAMGAAKLRRLIKLERLEAVVIATTTEAASIDYDAKLAIRAAKRTQPWNCLQCGQANVAEADRCEKCGGGRGYTPPGQLQRRLMLMDNKTTTEPVAATEAKCKCGAPKDDPIHSFSTEFQQMHKFEFATGEGAAEDRVLFDVTELEVKR